ncbi:MAG TPA: peptidylprolyl isomerase [Candidatus Limnocylindria bacterium]|nr:peptidylprolyl isomerase [Candidatus Limnocylindria bacterium]
MRVLAALALVLASCGGTAAAPTPTPIQTRVPTATAPSFPSPTTTVCATAGDVGKPATKATIVLARGEIAIALRADKAPNTVANFAKNARECRYNGLIFHRVESWVIQGGDPLGTGTGGGNQPTELSDLPFSKGAVGIARGPDPRVSNLMQFFVLTQDARHLDNAYTNFGRVTAGQDVADRVQRGDRILAIRIE